MAPGGDDVNERIRQRVAQSRRILDRGDPRAAATTMTAGLRAGPDADLAGGGGSAVASVLTDCALALMRAMGGNHDAAALDEIEQLLDQAIGFTRDPKQREDIGGTRAAVRRTRANMTVPESSPDERERFRQGFAQWVAPHIADGRHSDAIRAARAWRYQTTDPAVRRQIDQFLGPYAKAPGELPPASCLVIVVLVLALPLGGLAYWFAGTIPAVITGLVVVLGFLGLSWHIHRAGLVAPAPPRWGPW